MKKITIIIFSLLVMTCSKKDLEPLTIGKRPYIAKQLKINGYYYQYFENRYYRIYFFYSNGVLINVDGNFGSFDEINNYFNKFYFNDSNFKNLAYKWGLFKIDSTQIEFERWYPSEWPYPPFYRSGTIINDTTFVITSAYKLENGIKTDISSVNEKYNFRQYSPKPDSTNTWVK